jgi:hypothetical protein
MNNNNKLIGLFCKENEIEQNINLIKYKFSNPAYTSKLYLFDTDSTGEYLITFNTNGVNNYTLSHSISLHRHKLTNTLFTLNALNSIIKEQNGNFLDPNFEVDFSEYRNTCLTGRLNQIKVVRTRINTVYEI